MAPEEFIQIAYRGVLGRQVDASGLATWSERLTTRQPEALLTSLTHSPEFLRNFLLEKIRRDGMQAAHEINGLLVHFQLAEYLHKVRLDLVQKILPKAGKILDLGGASGTPQGALLEMGYPHANELTIIDLPLDTRMKPGPDQSGERTFGGTKVQFSYHSMADLSYYSDASFDMVWSGQTIEHISEQEGIDLFPQVWRVLKPGGIFALDTPNRAVTRMTVGDDRFIHAEHKLEYFFDQFIRLYDDIGFIRRKSLGLIDMSKSLELGYTLLEELQACDVSDKPEAGYCFYVEYQKPA